MNYARSMNNELCKIYAFKHQNSSQRDLDVTVRFIKSAVRKKTKVLGQFWSSWSFVVRVAYAEIYALSFCKINAEFNAKLDISTLIKRKIM